MGLDIVLERNSERHLDAGGGKVAAERFAELALITAHGKPEDNAGRIAARSRAHVTNPRIRQCLARVRLNIRAQRRRKACKVDSSAMLKAGKSRDAM